MPYSLSNKRESFCRYVAIDGLTPTAAYIKSFNVTSEKRKTATEAASRLMSDGNVAAMIQDIKQGIQDKLSDNVVWDKQRIVSELSINVDLGRETKQLAASNQALKLIGSAVGNVWEPETMQVNGTLSILHSLSDSVLEKLEALSVPDSEAVTVDDTVAIEADYSVIEPED